MRIPITVPEFSSGGEPLRLGDWSVEIGTAVEEGDCLAELISPGLAIDLAAPAAGVITELLWQPDHLVTRGDILGWLDSPAGSVSQSD